MYKKPTAVSHSSTESEIISPDAGLRKDELFALDLWDIVIEVLRSNQQQCTTQCDPSFQNQGEKVKRRQKVHQLSDVDCVLTNTFFSK